MKGPPHNASSTDIIVLSSDSEDDNQHPRTHAAVPRSVVSHSGEMNVSSSSASAMSMDPLDALQSKVLEIIPDVELPYLRNLLSKLYTEYGDEALQHALHQLCEDVSYPRFVKILGKRKRSSEDDDDTQEISRKKAHYPSSDRESTGGPHYQDLAFTQLLIDFPYIPKPYVRHKFQAHRHLYAPTYLFLARERDSGAVPYQRKTVPTRITGKGNQLHDSEFDQELKWLTEYLAKNGQLDESRPKSSKEEDSDNDECEDGVECGCCFSKFAFDTMVQCPEAHLFCRTCCRSYAGIRLSMQDYFLRCMDQSGCKELFPEAELQRMLPPKLMNLYHRLKQAKEIEDAELNDLEECPFCEYKVVIENPDEKLLVCEAEECGAITCRSCKKLDHLPKSCKEAQDDSHLTVKHAIEEAMTKALTRNCPKCSKPFIKENGCNKMFCPYCSTLSCYICRKVITGYPHFGQERGRKTPVHSAKCPLWDSTDVRHNNEIREAALKAIAEYKEKHPEIPEEALQVDIPKEFQNHGMTSGQAYVLQGQAYVPQGQAYVPQGQAYIPQGQAYVPQGQAYIPQGQAYVPQGQAYIPQGQAYAPQGQAYAPQGQAYVPQGQAYIPQGHNMHALLRELGGPGRVFLQQQMVQLPVNNQRQQLPQAQGLAAHQRPPAGNDPFQGRRVVRRDQ